MKNSRSFAIRTGKKWLNDWKASIRLASPFLVSLDKYYCTDSICTKNNYNVQESVLLAIAWSIFVVIQADLNWLQQYYYDIFVKVNVQIIILRIVSLCLSDIFKVIIFPKFFFTKKETVHLYRAKILLMNRLFFLNDLRNSAFIIIYLCCKSNSF